MAVTFRYANLDEYPRIAGFLNDYWANNHVYVRDKPLFDWTFHKPGLWDEPGYSFALAEDEGDLVGILGGIPFAFNSFGKASRGVWIANYVVRPDHRRGSAALQLLSMFRRPSMHAVVAYGINPATSTIYRVLRGEVLPYIPRHVGVFPGAAERAVNLMRIANPDWTLEKAQAVAAPLCLAALPEAPAQVGDAIPAQWDEVDWPAFAAETIGASRNLEFLNWRYRDHPRFKYQIVTVREGERTGLLIWRLETIRRDTPNGREDVEKVGRILELMPVSRDNARGLLGAALRQICVAGAFGVDFYGFHGGVNASLEEAGLVDTRNVQDGAGIPSRFQPLDGKGGGILSAMFLQEATRGFEDANCAWYWTKADSDQERPN
ncbi:MAG: GNAT family N-acetyltransferase [Candidatus Solibacter sp.]